MSSITLPTTRRPVSMTPAPLDFGVTQTSPLGAPSQRLDRLGLRFKCDVIVSHMAYGSDARIYVGRLLRARSQGAILPFLQPGFDVGSPGTPLVDGAGHLGTALPMRGLTSGYLLTEGQFFSIIHGGRRYLHSVAANVAAGSDGKASVSIWPPLRFLTTDADVVEIVQPMIEGDLSGDAGKWTITRARTDGISFTISEVA